MKKFAHGISVDSINVERNIFNTSDSYTVFSFY